MCFSYHKDQRNVYIESTIMLRESSQGESSVMRVRLEGRKKPIRGCKKKTLRICTSGANMH